MLQKHKPINVKSQLLVFGGICEGLEEHERSEGNRGCKMTDWEIKEGEEEEEEMCGSDAGPCDINSQCGSTASTLMSVWEGFRLRGLGQIRRWLASGKRDLASISQEETWSLTINITSAQEKKQTWLGPDLMENVVSSFLPGGSMNNYEQSSVLKVNSSLYSSS